MFPLNTLYSTNTDKGLDIFVKQAFTTQLLIRMPLFSLSMWRRVCFTDPQHGWPLPGSMSTLSWLQFWTFLPLHISAQGVSNEMKLGRENQPCTLPGQPSRELSFLSSLTSSVKSVWLKDKTVHTAAPVVKADDCVLSLASIHADIVFLGEMWNSLNSTKHNLTRLKKQVKELEIYRITCVSITTPDPRPSRFTWYKQFPISSA